MKALENYKTFEIPHENVLVVTKKKQMQRKQSCISVFNKKVPRLQ